MAALFEDLIPAGQQQPPAGGMFDDIPVEPRFKPGDLLKGLKRGVQQVPGSMTGLVDIPGALLLGDRYADKAADIMGDMTGFKPGKWAKETELSPGAQAAQQELDAAWKKSGADRLGTALLTNHADLPAAWDQANLTEAGKAIIQNPGASLMNVVESVPSMLVGGAIGKGLNVAAKMAPVLAGAAGEGLVTAGQQMDQTDPTVDPRMAAATSLATGAGTAMIAGVGGKVAQKLGLEDIQTAMAGGRAEAAGRGAAARIGGGAASEAGQEALQSGQEQAWQNFAEDKPLGQGVIRGAVEGAIAGAVMGGGANLLPSRPPQPVTVLRQDGLGEVVIDPQAGPISAAAADHVARTQTTEDLFGDLTVAAPVDSALDPMGGAPETGDMFADLIPSEQAAPSSPLQEFASQVEAVDLSEAQRLVQQSRDAGSDLLAVIEHPAGGGFIAAPREWLNADQVQATQGFQPGALSGRIQYVLDAYDEAGHPDNGKIIRAALKSRAPTEQAVTFWEKQLERNQRTWHSIAGQGQPVEAKLRNADDLWQGEREQTTRTFVPAEVTAAVLARSNILVQQLAERGVHLDEVDSRFPPEVTGIKAQESGLRGLFLRYAKQLEAKAKGYKRYDPAALAKTEAELFNEIGYQPAIEPAANQPITATTPAAIQDFGEKVGGARKDIAQPLGPKPKAAAPAVSEPGWRKRFTAVQNMLRSEPSWNLFDTKTSKPVRGAEFKSEQEARDAIPMIAVAQKHRVTSTGEGFEIMRDVTDRKRIKVVDQIFPTRDAAMKYMAEHAAEIIETKTSFREELFAKPEKVMRQGSERRTGKATAEDFTKTFGFRGVEFGLWNNQDERQEVMNHAYDGLLDLADVLDVPPKALSLNGDLALAFGARGQGLSGAVAHYERSYGVINLTKMQGAGALAHEWFHAADHYFGRQDGKAKSVKEQNKRGDLVYPTDGPSDYASHGFRVRNSGVREEVRAKYQVLLQTMFTKAEKYVEDTAKAEKFVGSSRDSLVRSLTGIRKQLESVPDWVKRNNKPATAEQLAEFDRLAADIIDGKAFELEVRSTEPKRGQRFGNIRLSNDVLDALSNLFKSVRGRSGMNAEKTGVVDGIRSDMRRYADRVKMLEDARSSNEKIKQVPTSYAMDAKRIDQGSATDYWTTEHEMAARAFSAYVEDKISEPGGRSDFLSYGSNNSMPEYRIFNVRPFPEGAERAAINQGFDQLFETLQTRETEKGVQLFNQVRGSASSFDGQLFGAITFGASLDNVLIAISQRSATPFNRELATLLLDQKLETTIKTTAHDGEHAGGYNPKANLITLMQEEEAEATILHELMHAATYKALSNKSVASGAMRALLREVRGHLGLDSHYGLSTIHEFVAEAFSNPEFQSALKSIQVKPSGIKGKIKDAWGRFVSNVRMILGLSREQETALGKALELGVRLMRENQSAPLRNYLGEIVFNQGKAAAEDRLTARDWISHQLANQRSWALGALTRDQLADIYGQRMPEVKEFDRVVQAMDQARNTIAEQADTIIERWRKLPIKTADTLAGIMHSATLEQFDPDIKTRDDVATPEQSILLKDWAALPDEAKQLYRDVRDQYAGTLAKLRNGLSKRAERAGSAGQRIAAEIRLQFDKYLAEGPYFPLARFGDFVLIADKFGQRIVEAFESSAAREKRARGLRVQGWTTKLTAKKGYSAAKDGPAGEFVGDVLKLVDGLEIEAKEKAGLMDSLNQLAISALPDQSYRRHFTHRKGTAGFSQDAMRAFASSMQHVGHHVARVLHGDELTLLLDGMNKRISETTGDVDTTVQQQVANELAKRLDLMMNPNTHPVTALAGQVGFVMSLGGSVASGLTNLSQTPLVTFPFLGAKFGFGHASAALTKASKDYFGGKWDKWSGFVLKDNKALSADEQRALQQLEDAGLVNLTQAHDLAGTANTDSSSSAKSFAMNRAMKIVGWTFHLPEVFNRQVSALAAYRLARDKGLGHEAGVEVARQALIRSHFDYSASNRSRWMAGNFTRVVTMFKQYSQNMTYLLWRNAYQSLKGESPEVKREARRMLLGLASMHFAAAGALGMPLGVFGISPLLGLLAMGMGSEDEPWDWQVEFRNMLADVFGKAGGEAIAHGPLRALTGVDFASRVGLGDLWIRAPQADKEGRDAVEAWMLTLLGPVAGYAGNIGTAAKAFDEGKVGRGLEAMLPKFIAAPIKAARYETDGVKSWTGDDLGVPLDGGDIFATAMGFQPAQLAEMYEGRAAIKGREGKLTARREEIANMFVAAALAGDQEMQVEAMGAAQAFSLRNPSMALTADSLRRSLQAKVRSQAMIKDGVYLSKKRQDLRAEGRFANVE
ncbi:MAG: PLxRFG domain-containing protein [Azonexus sp.]